VKRKLIVQPSDAQRLFLESNAHIVGFVGGYGAGKTWVTTLNLLRQPPERFPALVMANSYRQLIDVCASTLHELSGGVARLNRGDMTVELPQGLVYLRSSRTPDNWRGINARYGVVDEAAYAPAAGMQQFIARLRGAPWSYCTTPRKQDVRGAPTWVYERIVLPAQEGRLSTSYDEVHAATETNPAIGSQYGQFLRETLGSTLAAQDVDGLWTDVSGGLCTWAEVRASTRPVPKTPPSLVVVGVDPAATTGETGIVTVGMYHTGQSWALRDLSGRMSAAQWSDVVVSEWREWFDRGVPCIVVAEINQGGTMVEATLRAVDPRVRVQTVRASVGKRARAEPVAALIRRGLALFAPDECDRLHAQWAAWDPAESADSPDRLDAHVWACTYLSSRMSDDSTGASAWSSGQTKRRVVI